MKTWKGLDLPVADRGSAQLLAGSCRNLEPSDGHPIL